MIDLDFSQLPQIIRGSYFFGLPSWLVKQIEPLDLPETLDRLRGAGNFIGQVSVEGEDWKNRALFRAALSEFRSVKEALRWDLGTGEYYSPTRSKNPLVHFIFRMRRVAVYLANASMQRHETSYPVMFFDEEVVVDRPVLMIRDVERYFRFETGLLKDYREADVARICDWFEENQRKYGAAHVIDVGIQVYGEELCTFYAHRGQKETAATVSDSS